MRVTFSGSFSIEKNQTRCEGLSLARIGDLGSLARALARGAQQARREGRAKQPAHLPKPRSAARTLLRSRGQRRTVDRQPAGRTVQVRHSLPSRRAARVARSGTFVNPDGLWRLWAGNPSSVRAWASFSSTRRCVRRLRHGRYGKRCLQVISSVSAGLARSCGGRGVRLAGTTVDLRFRADCRGRGAGRRPRRRRGRDRARSDPAEAADRFRKAPRGGAMWPGLPEPPGRA
jgi:hypothetical protein